MELTVAEAGARLDAYVASVVGGLSRAQAQRWIDEGAVRVNGRTVKSSYKVQLGDTLLVTPPAIKPSHLVAEEIPLEILFEDDDLLVVNKPKGMVVHPAPGAEEGTLVHALLAHAPGMLSVIGGEERPGIVHRLDKDTSGLLMVAKNDETHRALQAQIQSREAKRTYLALLWGSPPFNEAVIEAPIGRHPGDRLKMTVRRDGEGREAVTDVTVKERFSGFVLVECRLRTGRTHQIRVHCQFAGYPVVGDPLYRGTRRFGDKVVDERLGQLNGQALHACALAFTHPRTGEALSFATPPPAELADLIAFLRAR